MRQAGRRPKLLFYRNEVAVQTDEDKSQDDFAIYATYQVSHGRFVGSLKVVRKADSRLLFPFDGAPTIGPFDKKEDAIAAAVALGTKIAEADKTNPEP